MAFRNKNICIIAFSLGGGGAEKVAALQSQMLKNLGYRVFVVSVTNVIEYAYQGKLLNLGELQVQNKRFFRRCFLLFELRRFLKDHAIDLIIDHRSRVSVLKEYFLKHLIFKTKTIFMAHSHNVSMCFPKSTFFSKCLYADSKRVVCVSKAIQEQVVADYGFVNTSTVYNPIDFADINSKLTGKTAAQPYVLFFGRLEEASKNLRFMIRAYQNSVLPSRGIRLYFLGEGPDLPQLQVLVADLGLRNHVQFFSHTTNPYPMVEQAKYVVLTSHFEGFPMALIEALACGTPVVSVDCKSGPSEIVQNESNGLLTSATAPDFTEALNRMVLDEKLYNTCKSNAKSSVAHLDMKCIAQDWHSLLQAI